MQLDLHRPVQTCCHWTLFRFFKSHIKHISINIQIYKKLAIWRCNILYCYIWNPWNHQSKFLNFRRSVDLFMFSCVLTNFWSIVLMPHSGHVGVAVITSFLFVNTVPVNIQVRITTVVSDFSESSDISDLALNSVEVPENPSKHWMKVKANGYTDHIQHFLIIQLPWVVRWHENSRVVKTGLIPKRNNPSHNM